MAFAPGCEPVPDVPFLGVGVAKAGSESPPRGRPYASLSGRSAFQRVFRSGIRRRSGGVVVIVASGYPGPPRVGVVAGAKKVGGAVARNRAKRRLRAALAGVPLRSGYDYVVIASPAVLSAPMGELKRWLRRAVGEETADG